MAEKVNMPSQKKEKKKKRKKKLPSDFYDYNLLACTILLSWLNTLREPDT